MKIGVSSQNFKTITGHAGKGRRFLIFTENENVGWTESNRLDLPKNLAMHEFRGTEHPLDELDVLITAGCGNGFIQRMAARGVKVVTTSITDPKTAVMHYAGGSPLPPPEPGSH